MRIAYDEEKRRKTIKDRNLDFEDAPEIFAGFHFNQVDSRKDYGEVRNITIGLIGEIVVVVVWTQRDESRRIISMRKADKDERGEYFQQLE